MGERALQLARQIFNVDADNTNTAVLSAVYHAAHAIEIYGREVQQKAANLACPSGRLDWDAERAIREMKLP